MVQIPYLLPRLVNGHINLVLSLDTVSNGSSSLALSFFPLCRLAFQLKSAAPNHDFHLCDLTCVVDCFCFQEDGSCECMPTVWMIWKALVQYSLDIIAYDVENVCITYKQQEVKTIYVFDRACHVPGGQVIDHLCTYHYYSFMGWFWPGCFLMFLDDHFLPTIMNDTREDAVQCRWPLILVRRMRQKCLPKEQRHLWHC